MLCTSCGTKLPHDARFCFNCGTAQVAGSSGIPGWEMCQIQFKVVKVSGIFSSPRLKFFAEGSNSKGPYSVAESEEFEGMYSKTGIESHPAVDYKETKAIFEHFVDRLVNDGWEHLKGGGWYEYTFRRRFKN